MKDGVATTTHLLPVSRAQVLQITMFVAFLTLDARRTNARLRDCCCCPPCRLPEGDAPSGDAAATAAEADKLKAPVDTMTAVVVASDGAGSVDLSAEGSSSPAAGSATSPAAGGVVEREGKLRSFLRDTYTPFLLQPAVKAGVCFFFLALAAVNVWGVTKVESEFKVRGSVDGRRPPHLHLRPTIPFP